MIGELRDYRYYVTLAGPFIITCNNESVFLRVTSNFQVVATSKIEESSDFYISYNEDGQSAYEFSITYLAPSALENREIKPISRYVYAPVNRMGKSPGPLALRLDAKSRDTKMTLHSRRETGPGPVDTKDWLNSRDIFYISCKQRTFWSNSYICVKRMPRNSPVAAEYTTYCVPDIDKHNEAKEHYMLFRLIRATKRNYSEKATKEKDLPLDHLGIHRKRYSSVALDHGTKSEDSGIQMHSKQRETREKTEVVVENETEM